MRIDIPTCTESEYQEAVAHTAQYTPDKAPLGWKELPLFPRGGGNRGFQRLGDRLTVIVSASRWSGDAVVDRVWLHVSLSRPHTMPSYQDMCEVKSLFVGADRKAFQVFAEESQHVNIHPYCLHLWCAVEGGDDLPNFGAAGTI